MGQEEQTALVTGASSGIGRETAIGLAQKGFRIIAAARRVDRLEELAAEYEVITPKQVDLSNPEDTAAFCTYLAELSEPVSVLVNNAGYSIRGVLEDVSMDAIRRIFQVNVFSLVQVTQACLPGMRSLRNGTVVNVSSVVGRLTFPGSGVYASTKFAVEAITDSLRMELAPFGIRVVTIRPGAIDTEFNEVAGQHTGDLMAKTDPDYKPVYGAAGAATGRIFAELTVPGPDLISNLILDAVLSDSPNAAYAAGPFTDDLLTKRAELDDDAFHRLMLEKFGLADLKV